MQTLILVLILLSALIYLHIVQNRLIFQPDIKAAVKLALSVLVVHAVSICISPLLVMMIVSGARNSRRIEASANASLILGSLFTLAIWILIIFAYVKFFSGCRKAAFFKRARPVDLTVREKVRKILLDAIERKWSTPEYKMFTQVDHDDPLVESIRRECKNINLEDYQSIDKQLEKLGELVDKLKE